MFSIFKNKILKYDEYVILFYNSFPQIIVQKQNQQLYFINALEITEQKRGGENEKKIYPE